MPTVVFENVGRDKKTFEADIRDFGDGDLDEIQMIRAIKSNGALGSRGIDFAEGTIFVGGCRAVGTYRIKEQ